MVTAHSRYRDVEQAALVDEDGRRVPYLRRRLLPQGADLEAAAVYVYKGDERLDNITAAYLADPELFWLICDANDALHPRDLCVKDRRLRIPLAERG